MKTRTKYGKGYGMDGVYRKRRAKAAWDKLTRRGVTDGSRPQDLITREEVATMIDRAEK